MSTRTNLALAAVLAVIAAPTLSLAQNQPAGRPRGGGTPPAAATPAGGGTPAGGTTAGGGTTTTGGGGSASGPVYNCVKNPKGVTVSFGKTELELQDLLDWAMTFACKNFIYQAGIGGRTGKVVIMSPKRL